MHDGLRLSIRFREETDIFLRDARSSRIVTRGALADAVRAWSGELAARRITPGARVLVDVDDPLAFAVAHLSLIAAGYESAPLDPAAPPAEAERLRRVLRPTAALTDRPGIGLEGAIPVGTGPLTGLPAAPAGTPREPDGRPGSAVLLTSGSTGTPKIVALPEAQLLHVGRAVARHHRLSPGDRGFNPLPLFHVNAQVVGLVAALVSGAELVLDRRFRRTGFWELLAEHDVTWLNAAPALLTVLARTGLGPVPPRLRFVRSASAPLPPAVREAVEKALGVPVVESYGMTEAASQITATPLDGGAPAGSVGRVVDGELEVVDRAGRPCRPGEVGRVRIRGAGVIRSYAGRDAFPGGWLDTADLGRIDDDGQLFLVGRADDVVNRGGELVHPREVEEVLLEEPGVTEAVVVARPDEVLGQVPVALVRGTGDDLVAALERRCTERLARWKRPAEIRLVETFPVGPTGKIRRAELRRTLA
ncbi:acyl--CoA ligase [Pseudonocardia ailaonensis]|uniref:Acyl--CoA ligase n=1 Tax=Pseudonocardia ailaonensis TaxID=367279 RepID=A0ABN2NN14_9PSEU